MSKLLISQYHAEVEKIIYYGGSRKETSIRVAFQNLLNEYCKPRDFRLIPELDYKTPNGKVVYPDGTVKDALRLDWGYWESKDQYDKLDEEIEKKFLQGYPDSNILFEDSQTAVLIQSGQETKRVLMKDTDGLDEIITTFINYIRPEVKDFRQAIENFKEDLPIILEALRDLIDNQAETNVEFQKTRNKFWDICKESINPEISLLDIREMMIQHILTEDIFINIFSESQFHKENNVARELQRVIDTFFTGSIKRNTLGTIERYYGVIRRTAANIYNHHEKQKFLKVIYENFYKAYNPKAADRLGIVYTPNEIVRFMIESVDYLTHKHFGKLLGDKGVEILDPATGTGTFVTELIEYLSKDSLAYKYKHEIHCNEVAILPYYIANLNIEYTYKQKMGVYEEFENICFVDTLEHTSFDGKQLDLFAMSVENTERIRRQNECDISVIIGNPPYNAKQENFNQNNANRAYPAIDKLIKETYIKYSKAQNRNVVYDMYTRFYRWATDRVKDGIICFITNSSLLDGIALDGFRKCIQDDFSFAYFIDLGGNVRAISEKNGIFISEKHTIFGKSAMTGIVICFLIKDSKSPGCKIFYSNPFHLHELRENKLSYLRENTFQNFVFEHIIPDKNYNWINQADNDFDTLLPLVDKDVKAGKAEEAVFKLFSSGIKTQRDEWAYDLSKQNLADKMSFFVQIYLNELYNQNINDLSISIKWDEDLRSYLRRGITKNFTISSIIESLYRPFYKEYLYFDKHFNGRTYQWFNLYKEGEQNLYLCIPGIGASKSFQCLMTNHITCLDFLEKTQCLPLYRYDKDGNRIDNITDWGLAQFQNHYKDSTITKLDIFHYTYAVLNNPAYRQKYELNLKREFPRLPLYDGFHQWASWGKQLMDLHINYETVALYPLKRIDLPFDESSRITPKAKLKADKTKGTIILDELTTLEGVPKIAWEYHLGNRCALEWILDQYKEKKPKDPTIAEKFNTYRFADYKEQVIDLLQRVCTVSVETMRIIQEMDN
ncbi:type ISP restriction/modification enzyme [Chlorogloeopsis sp. ULAP02]|uniref:type ISP restriction/modification enzyme n=1 Tax=Chlorogloeopsis sp. ULAP02 TaxID=3107926 RepID=UPI003134F427